MRAIITASNSGSPLPDGMWICSRMPSSARWKGLNSARPNRFSHALSSSMRALISMETGPVGSLTHMLNKSVLNTSSEMRWSTGDISKERKCVRSLSGRSRPKSPRYTMTLSGLTLSISHLHWLPHEMWCSLTSKRGLLLYLSSTAGLKKTGVK